MEATETKPRLQATCGKVTINKVQKALGSLRAEGNTFIERVSFIDDNGEYQTRDAAYMSCYGGVSKGRSDEVNKYWESLQEKINYVLSVENYKDVIKDLQDQTELMKAGRPIKDSTIPEPELRQQRKEAAARAEASRIEHEEANALLEREGTTIPAGAMAIMLSEHFDDSDMMSDYSNRHASASNSPARCIGIVKLGPQREDTMRNIIEAIPELKGRFVWKYHKEEYSGGHGTYLEAQESHRTDENQKLYRGGTGAPIFYEVSCNKYLGGKRVLCHPQMVDRYTVSDVHTHHQLIGSCNVSRNEARNGIELRFQDKPSPEVLDFLKGTLHARWHWKKKIWYCKYSEERLEAIRKVLG